MNDDQEIKCILTLIHVLRNQNAEDHISNEKGTRKRRFDHLSIEDENEKLRIQQKQRPPIALPDAVIRDGILSYQPFRPFRVVLIRGEDSGIQWNDHNRQNIGGREFSLGKKSEYSLTFRSNRGPLRFRVVELPYLPPTNHNNRAEAETYRAADGVIISCYMARFFEFCNRYGYNYASTRILEDITKRRIQEHESYTPYDDNDSDVLAQQDQKRARTAMKQKFRKDYENSIVLCGNNVDITHVDARLSSIVFREPTMEPSSTTSNTTFMLREPPTCFIESPKHPFSSLARSLTGDDELEFIDVPGNSFSCREDSGRPLGLLASQEEEQRFEKYKRSNDDDLCNWNWLRAQVSS